MKHAGVSTTRPALIVNKFGTRYVARPNNVQAATMREQRWWELARQIAKQDREIAERLWVA